MTLSPDASPASHASSPTFLCQVDKVIHNAHAIFGFGWAFDRTGIIVSGTLRLQFADAGVSAVRISMERARDDVAAAFPDCPQATQAGFMFMAGWDGGSPEKAELVFEMADGGLQRTELSLAAPVSDRSQVVERRSLLIRGLAHLRQGSAGEWARKAWRCVRPRATPADESLRSLAAALGGRHCRVVIDHAMGGGANLFRERMTSEWVAGGDTVVLLSFRLAEMTPFIEVTDGGRKIVLTLQRLDDLAELMADATLTEIFFNCAVSFPRAEEVQRLVLSLKRRFGARLVVAMHEYFLVCPSPFLLDNHGRFCGVPSLDRCHTCLAEHEDGFVSLAGERSIERWRSMWGEVLMASDEVRCFSDSTRRLLASVYPFTVERMTLRPHQVDPLRPVRPRTRGQAPMTVGVIGAISQHKGAHIVADLANAIVDAGADIRIVIVGSIDAACPPDVVEQTGPYQRDELPDLIEKHRIDIALLPSICPETFSFVAHEVVATGLPLLCLDLGAQADLARSLQAGWVSSRQDGPGLLEALMAFDHHLNPLRLKVVT